MVERVCVRTSTCERERPENGWTRCLNLEGTQGDLETKKQTSTAQKKKKKNKNKNKRTKTKQTNIRNKDTKSLYLQKANLVNTKHGEILSQDWNTLNIATGLSYCVVQ